MADLMQQIRRMGINPKRSLGQNFLVDSDHLDHIVAAANVQPDDSILEIGPGPGTLTARLAALAGKVVAVELDNRLIELLRQEFADRPHVEIVHGDILEIAPHTLFVPSANDSSFHDSSPSEQSASESPTSSLTHPSASARPSYKVVANLPYYITNAVLRHLLEADVPPTEAVVLVQKEVAARVCAEPGDLSLLAVSVQFYAEPKTVHQIPAEAFYPQPQVDSAVLRLNVRPQPAITSIAPKRFFQVVRAGFSQKRKQLANSLSGGLGLPKPMLREVLTEADVDPKRRAETVTLAEWEQICLALNAEQGDG